MSIAFDLPRPGAEEVLRVQSEVLERIREYGESEDFRSSADAPLKSVLVSKKRVIASYMNNFAARVMPSALDKEGRRNPPIVFSYEDYFEDMGALDLPVPGLDNPAMSRRDFFDLVRFVHLQVGFAEEDWKSMIELVQLNRAHAVYNPDHRFHKGIMEAHARLLIAGIPHDVLAR